MVALESVSVFIQIRKQDTQNWDVCCAQFLIVVEDGHILLQGKNASHADKKTAFLGCFSFFIKSYIN